MCWESLYIDFVYSYGDESYIKSFIDIPPGEIVLRNTEELNLFRHPHVELWHRFLRDIFNPRICLREKALILPCSGIKPYRLSATHRVAESIIDRYGLRDSIQVYILSEPMIIVPRELDIYYPFANYDYPPRELDGFYRDMFIELLSIVIPRLRHYKKIVAILPKHHKNILLKSIERANGVELDIGIVDYGRKAFESIRKGIELLI